jgi:hypothetical protein
MTRNGGDLKFHILRAIRTLTPPNVMECSTQEVCALMAEDGVKRDVRSVASLVGALCVGGYVVSRLYMQRKLWKLTARGRHFLTVEYEHRARGSCKAPHTKNR